MPFQIALSRSLPGILRSPRPLTLQVVLWHGGAIHHRSFPWQRPFIPGLQRQYQQTQYTFFSTEENSSMSYNPLEWWRGRQESKEAEKYKERIQSMAEQESWVVGDMLKELDEVNKSWMAKMPVLSDNKETKMAKAMYKTLSGIAQVAGEDADGETLENLMRKDRLKAALLGETTVQDINLLIKQFQIMTLMHKVLRTRKLEGKSIPTTAEGIQALMQQDAGKFLTKKQKKQMGKDQMRRMMRNRS